MTLLKQGVAHRLGRYVRRETKFLSLTVHCRRKMDGKFGLSCLKIALTNFTAEHEELKMRDRSQAMLPGCTFI